MKENKKSILFTKKLSKSELSLINNERFDVKSENFIKILYLYPNQVPESEHFIITSQNGAESLINLFSTDYLKDTKYYIVGEKAAKRISYFSENIICVEDDAENLAEKLISSKIENFVHFCSDIHLTYIKEKLNENNIKVQEIISYQTLSDSRKIDDFFDGIAFFSPSGIKSFFENNQLKSETTIFSIGKTTSKELTKYNLNNKVIIAEKPNLESLIEVIQNEFKY